MSQVIRSHRKRLSLFAVAALAVAALGVGFNHAGAQQAEAELRVGTYEPQEAFQLYHRTAEFQQQMQELQAQAQQQDPEALGQLQQQAEQMQQELIQNFQRDVETAVPELAEEANVDIVAVEVVYSAEEIEVEDLTAEVIDKINEGAEQPPEEDLPPLPVP